MGLDMYLKGEDFVPTYGDAVRDDAGRVSCRDVCSAHCKAWRKFAPLHCHIVNVCSDEGHDDCEPSPVDERRPAHDCGRDPARRLAAGRGVPRFFLWHAQEMWAEDRKRAAEDAAIFDTAADWLDRGDMDRSWRSVIYQASW
jgi:hypothetical protein